MPTSCSHYFRETVAGAARSGVDTRALMSAVGVSAEQLDDPAWRGDLRLLARLVQLLVEALDDEFMGFLGERSRPGTFAMMTHCIAYEPTVEQALRKGVRFYSLFTDAIEMSLEATAEGAVWSVKLRKPELDRAHYYTEFWLSIWCRLVGWLSGEQPQLRRATFAYLPAASCRDELGLLFQCPLEFEAPVTSLVLDKDFLGKPIMRTRKELKEFLAETPLGVMTPTATEATAARRVMALVRPRETHPLEFPSFATVASSLYLTEQTLRRRLRTEDTSYRDIKERVRREEAERLLRGTDLSVQEVSRWVGYSELRAFTRAFKGWTGLNPAAFRTVARSGPDGVDASVTH